MPLPDVGKIDRTQPELDVAGVRVAAIAMEEDR
jgi:hypothetical protein